MKQHRDMEKVVIMRDFRQCLVRVTHAHTAQIDSYNV